MIKSTVERLALIKFHFNHGIEQSKQVDPLNGFSILTFHDTIELFLNNVCEQKNIKIPKEFMNYWTEINKKIIPEILSHQTSMQRLNKARVNFKHNGIIPSKSDIESFKIMTQTFFEENFIKFFNVDFSQVSLIDLIENKRSKERLKEAENAFQIKSIEECLSNLTISFAYLLHDYESNKKDKRYRSPFDFRDPFKSLRNIPVKSDYETKRFLTNVSEAINKIQNVLRLITMGVDYKQYVKFSALTPEYGFTSDDEVVPYKVKRKTLSKEEFEFGKNFIINTAIKFQESDFKLDENDYYG